MYAQVVQDWLFTSPGPPFCLSPFAFFLSPPPPEQAAGQLAVGPVPEAFVVSVDVGRYRVPVARVEKSADRLHPHAPENRRGEGHEQRAAVLPAPVERER